MIKRYNDNDSWIRGFAYGMTQGEKKVYDVLDKIAAEIDEAYDQSIENEDNDFSGLAEARLIIEEYRKR